MNDSSLQPESNQCQYCCGKALESGSIGKANDELNEGISILTNRQKMIKLLDKSEFGCPSFQEYICDNLADDDSRRRKKENLDVLDLDQYEFDQ